MRQRAKRKIQEIERHLQYAIDNGEILPGERIPPERELCSRFNASRAVIRAALANLANSGLLATRLGSGTYVSAYPEHSDTPRSFDIPVVSPLDVLEARCAIEPGYMELVAARATEDDFERMRSRLRELRDARDQIEYKKAGYAFQLEVVRASRNPILITMEEMIVAARARAGWNTLTMLNETAELKQKTLNDMTAIYEALERRDSEGAARTSSRMLKEMIRTILTAPLGA